MTPAQLNPFINAWKNRELRTDHRLALLLTQTTNTLLAVHGSKQTVRIESFLPHKHTKPKRLTQKQILAKALHLFPRT